MDSIKNYKLRDFLTKDAELQIEYITILRLLETIPTKNRLVELKLGEVEFIKRSINDDEALPEIFELMEGIKENELMNMKIVTFYSLLNDIIKQIEKVISAEQQHLTPKHTNVKWEAVEGSKRLQVLGVIPMVDTLAGGDILKYEEVLEMSYNTVFNKMMLDVIKGDLEHEMSKIKTEV
jgi:uncharacterized protein YbjQ (UPF0145 family)